LAAAKSERARAMQVKGSGVSALAMGGAAVAVAEVGAGTVAGSGPEDGAGSSVGAGAAGRGAPNATNATGAKNKAARSDATRRIGTPTGRRDPAGAAQRANSITVGEYTLGLAEPGYSGLERQRAAGGSE